MPECGNEKVTAPSLAGLTVADVATTRLKTLRSSARVSDVRQLFGNAHVLTALLVDADGAFVCSVERCAVPAEAADDEPAQKYRDESVGVVAPSVGALDALQRMRRDHVSRLVVVDEETGRLQGLVCLTATGDSFCH